MDIRQTIADMPPSLIRQLTDRVTPPADFLPFWFGEGLGGLARDLRFMRGHYHCPTLPAALT